MKRHTSKRLLSAANILRWSVVAICVANLWLVTTEQAIMSYGLNGFILWLCLNALILTVILVKFL